MYNSGLRFMTVSFAGIEECEGVLNDLSSYGDDETRGVHEDGHDQWPANPNPNDKEEEAFNNFIIVYFAFE